MGCAVCGRYVGQKLALPRYSHSPAMVIRYAGVGGDTARPIGAVNVHIQARLQLQDAGGGRGTTI